MNEQKNDDIYSNRQPESDRLTGCVYGPPPGWEEFTDHPEDYIETDNRWHRFKKRLASVLKRSHKAPHSTPPQIYPEEGDID